MTPNPTLVHALRGGIVESTHRGALAVVDADGTVHTQLGDITRPIFPRSAIKVLQALPLVASGAAEHWRLNDEELALACASHGGEPRHAETAAAMLAKAGVDAAALECGAHWPYHDGAIKVPCFWRWPTAIRGGRDIDRIASPIDVLPLMCMPGSCGNS